MPGGPFEQTTPARSAGRSDAGGGPGRALPGASRRPGPASAPRARVDPVALAKADLHVHLVGSAALGTVATLAAHHPGAGVPSELVALRDFYAYQDFPHFLDVYRAVSALVRSPEDLLALVSGLASDLDAQGTCYAEVTVTPVTHLRAGIAADEIAWALDLGASRARAEHGVELAWVYDISGGDGPEGAELTLDAALHHAPSGLVGFGLGGPERAARRAEFAPWFSAARAAGLHSVPHAGESVGAEEVWAALDVLGAERVGHGTASAGDARLLDRLAHDGVVLEVCLSSNVATKVVPSLAEHPLRRFLDAGVAVVLGSDDPPMFATSLPVEYRLARDVLQLDDATLRALARASIEASFASDSLKRQLLERAPRPARSDRVRRQAQPA